MYKASLARTEASEVGSGLSLERFVHLIKETGLHEIQACILCCVKIGQAFPLGALVALLVI